jgi:3-oxoadipate CoA-transferase beta subunit
MPGNAPGNSHGKLTRRQIAWRIVQDIEEGNYVNLGIGQPELVADLLPADREVIIHSENGILGLGPKPTPEEADEDLINAGKKMATLVPGGAFFHHADSFSMIRGGHIDICVLGAFQVAENGDLANWTTGGDDLLPAVGGAMDLAAGAKKVFVMMDHNAKDGASKIVKQCSYPLTGRRCVTTVYTEIAVIDIKPEGCVVREKFSDMPMDALQARTGARLTLANDWRPLTVPDVG